MVKQYPYILYTQQLSGGGFNSDGDPIEPTPVFVPHSKCRDESNIGGKVVTMIDGSVHMYEALVQLPKKTEALQAGTLIYIMDGSDIRLQGTIKFFRREQMHCRIWV